MKKTNRKIVLAGVMTAAMLFSASPLAVLASSAPGYLVAASAVTATASTETSAADAVFTFSDSGITAAGETSGYKIEGTALTINASGTYTITGSCTEGSIKVKKGTTGVTLILKDLTLTSATTAPLSINKGSEAAVYVVGTVTLNDNEDPSTEETNEDFEGAAIKVKSEGAKLTIDGTGTLNLNGNAKNGIKGAATATVTIAGATVNVKAAGNGVACDNTVTVTGGTLNITAGNDGIKAEPDEDDADSAGTVTISGGKVTIDAQGDGIQATNDVTITGGTFNITTFGGCTKAKSLGTDDSAKGIKSDSKVTISGGTFTLNTADDAIHSNGDVVLKGGAYTIRAGDDGIHADNDLSLDNVDLTISTSYEGLEGARVYLNSGKGAITASDDGVNAATDLSVNEIAIYINGGTWTINANGDGLDAGGDSRNNAGGNLVVKGGTTIVYGAANSGNAALDFDGTYTHTGGAVLAIGMSGMAQVPTSGSYLLFGSGGMMGGFGGMAQTTSTGSVSVTAGATLSIKDAGGNELISATAVRSANSIVFASDALTSGQTYTLYVNGTAAATATVSTGNGQSGGMGQMGGRFGGMSGQMGGFGQRGQTQQGTATQPTAPQGQSPFGGQQGQLPAMGRDQAPDATTGATAPGQGRMPEIDVPQQEQLPELPQETAPAREEKTLDDILGEEFMRGWNHGPQGRSAELPAQEEPSVQEEQPALTDPFGGMDRMPEMGQGPMGSPFGGMGQQPGGFGGMRQGQMGEAVGGQFGGMNQQSPMGGQFGGFGSRFGF